jgi:hypothetical protein
MSPIDKIFAAQHAAEAASCGEGKRRGISGNSGE